MSVKGMVSPPIDSQIRPFGKRPFSQHGANRQSTANQQFFPIEKDPEKLGKPRVFPADPRTRADLSTTGPALLLLLLD